MEGDITQDGTFDNPFCIDGPAMECSLEKPPKVVSGYSECLTQEVSCEKDNKVLVKTEPDLEESDTMSNISMEDVGNETLSSAKDEPVTSSSFLVETTPTSCHGGSPVGRENDSEADNAFGADIAPDLNLGIPLSTVGVDLNGDSSFAMNASSDDECQGEVTADLNPAASDSNFEPPVTDLAMEVDPTDTLTPQWNGAEPFSALETTSNDQSGSALHPSSYWKHQHDVDTSFVATNSSNLKSSMETTTGLATEGDLLAADDSLFLNQGDGFEHAIDGPQPCINRDNYKISLESDTTMLDCPSSEVRNDGPLEEPGSTLTAQNQMPSDDRYNLRSHPPSKKPLVDILAAKDSPKRKAASRKAGARPKKKSSTAGEKKSRKTRKAEHRARLQGANLDSLNTGRSLIEEANSAPGFGQVALTGADKSIALQTVIDGLPAHLRKSAITDKHIILEASRKFDGPRAIGVDEKSGKWRLKGLDTTLMHHQLLGVAFMRERENGTEEPHGGILADAPGLGKTVEALANIINGTLPPGSRPRATLIVVPAAVREQWASETDKHVSKEAHVRFYRYDKCKEESEILRSAFEAADIVLATYNDILKSDPDVIYPVGVESEVAKQKYYWENFGEEGMHRGPLHRTQWLRVILDEGHAIKTHDSKTAKACHSLRAQHYWIMSGTPLVNSVDEAFSYFKFLHIKEATTIDNFRREYGPKTDSGKEKLNEKLHKFMIRRTYATCLMGAPIIRLPVASELIQMVKQNSFEKVLYFILRSRLREAINNTIRPGRDLNKQVPRILTTLLRLRQLADHFFLVESTLKQFLTEEDVQTLRAVAEQMCGFKHRKKCIGEFLNVRRTLAANAYSSQQTKAETTTLADCSGGKDLPTACQDSFEYDLGRRPEGIKHGLNYNATGFVDDIEYNRDAGMPPKKETCPRCHKCMVSIWELECDDRFCEHCVTEMEVEAELADQLMATCTQCGKLWQDSQPVDKTEEIENCASLQWIDRPIKNILPSGKTIYVKAQIMNWIEENPQVKIIVFTQFRPMMNAISKMCIVEGWGHVQFHGDLSHKSREEVKEQFGVNQSISILIISTKAGGVGLNLTMAQKVIICDPWWNQSQEDQAFGRVFRIGQTSKTSLVRLITQRTVEEKMLLMQKHKQSNIDKIINPLQLLECLGTVHKDENGVTRILDDGNDFDDDGDEVAKQAISGWLAVKTRKDLEFGPQSERTSDSPGI